MRIRPFLIIALNASNRTNASGVARESKEPHEAEIDELTLTPAHGDPSQQYLRPKMSRTGAAEAALEREVSHAGETDESSFTPPQREPSQQYPPPIMSASASGWVPNSRDLVESIPEYHQQVVREPRQSSSFEELFSDLFGLLPAPSPLRFPDIEPLSLNSPINPLSEIVSEFKRVPGNAEFAKRAFSSLHDRISMTLTSSPILTSFSVLDPDTTPRIGLTDDEAAALTNLLKIVERFMRRIPVNGGKLKFGRYYLDVYNIYEYVFERLTGDPTAGPRSHYIRYVDRLQQIQTKIGTNHIGDLVAVYWWFFSHQIDQLEIAKAHDGESVVAVKKLRSICEINASNYKVYPEFLNNLILEVFSLGKKIHLKPLFFDVVNVFTQKQAEWAQRNLLGSDGAFRPGTYEPLYYLRHISMLAGAHRRIYSRLKRIVENSVEVNVWMGSSSVTIIRIKHTDGPVGHVTEQDKWPKEALEWILNVRYASDRNIPKEVTSKFEASLVQMYFNELLIRDKLVRIPEPPRDVIVNMRRDLMKKLVLIYLKLSKNQTVYLDKVSYFASKIESELFLAGTIAPDTGSDHLTQYRPIEDIQREFAEIEKMSLRLKEEERKRNEEPIKMGRHK